MSFGCGNGHATFSTSPGEVQAKRNMIPAMVDELNKGLADERGVRLEVSRLALASCENSRNPSNSKLTKGTKK